MIDIIAVLLFAALLTTALLALWRRIGGMPASRARAWTRRAATALLAIAVTLYGTYRLGRARTVQVFGEIVQRVETTDSVVALTFDDGPQPGATERVLAMLAAEDVRASFFLIGRDMEENPEQVALIARAGHEIGNHTFTHQRMAGVSLATVEQEIVRTDSAIRRAGYRGPIHFRSPYCWKLFALPWYLAREDRTQITFDVEPESDPAIDGDPERIVADVLATTRPGSIILLHVMYRGREASLSAVPSIIRGLKSRGYRFVTAGELVAGS